MIFANTFQNHISIFRNHMDKTIIERSSSTDTEPYEETIPFTSPTNNNLLNESENTTSTRSADVASLNQTTSIVHEPLPMDIMLGRGRWNTSHPGNRRLQIFINIHLDRYQRATTRKAKTKITREVVFAIKNCGTSPGRFIQFHEEEEHWFEVDDVVARLKVAQAFRYTMRSRKDSIVTDEMLLDFDRQQQSGGSTTGTIEDSQEDSDKKPASTRKRKSTPHTKGTQSTQKANKDSSSSSSSSLSQTVIRTLMKDAKESTEGRMISPSAWMPMLVGSDIHTKRMALTDSGSTRPNLLSESQPTSGGGNIGPRLGAMFDQWHSLTSTNLRNADNNVPTSSYSNNNDNNNNNYTGNDDESDIDDEIISDQEILAYLRSTDKNNNNNNNKRE